MIKRRGLRFWPLFLVGLSILLVHEAKAVTAEDYYQAGLKLYEAQDYGRAVKYFDAALGMEPSNAAALQGRASCRYAQGDLKGSLQDYEKALALNPSPQLSQFVASLRTQVGAPAPTQPPANDPFQEGKKKFTEGKYSEAVPVLEKAIQADPGNAQALYYLGLSQMQGGDQRKGLVALGLFSKKQYSPQVEDYANRSKSFLSEEDRGWVNRQMALPDAYNAVTGKEPKRFGLRFQPSLNLIGMGDFVAEAETTAAYTEELQNSDPSYYFDATVPQGYLNVCVEPVLLLGSDIEVGFPISVLPVGTFTETYGNDSSAGSTGTIAMDGISFGVNGRFLFGKAPFRFFVGGGPLLIPMDMRVESTGGGSASGDFSGFGFGGQLQGGMDWSLGESFTVTPFVGFQVASIEGFKGYARIPENVTGEMIVWESPYGEKIQFLEDGTSTGGATYRPLKVDLTGLKGGIQLSAFF